MHLKSDAGHICLFCSETIPTSVFHTRSNVIIRHLVITCILEDGQTLTYYSDHEIKDTCNTHAIY